METRLTKNKKIQRGIKFVNIYSIIVLLLLMGAYLSTSDPKGLTVLLQIPFLPIVLLLGYLIDYFPSIKWLYDIGSRNQIFLFYLIQGVFVYLIGYISYHKKD